MINKKDHKKWVKQRRSNEEKELEEQTFVIRIK